MDTVIRDNVFNHRRPQHFLDEAESAYGDALHYTVVYMAELTCSVRLFHLRNGIDILITLQGKTVQQSSDEKWVTALAFTAHITAYLNESNMNFQRQRQLVYNMFSVSQNSV
jgi:hypothetical protein